MIPQNLFFLSAAPFELAPLRALLPDWPDDRFLSCGIGPLDTAAQVSRLAERLSGTQVIFLGSCGVFGEFSQVKLITPSRSLWLPTCERILASSPIENLTPPFELSPQESALEKATVLCAPNISLTGEIHPRVREQYGLQGLLVENMELYSLTPLIQAVASFIAILAITNGVGPKGRLEWRENFKEGARLAGEYALGELK
jgi:hypothetical protein